MDAWGPETISLARRTSEGIARILRSEIFTGELAAGATLPERLLAERLQVSRTPVREALIILQSEGLVELVPNKGASVRTITTDDLVEIYTLRGLLESHAARLASEHATITQLDAMEDAQTRLRRMHARGSAADQAVADLEFHTAVTNAAGSPFLATLVGQVLAFTVSFRANYKYPHERSQAALVEHDAIFTAISARDSDLAERLMREHVASSCDFALAQFDDAADEA
jgi:DNA-binding GntR family transcriptional regulator